MKKFLRGFLKITVVLPCVVTLVLLAALLAELIELGDRFLKEPYDA